MSGKNASYIQDKSFCVCTGEQRGWRQKEHSLWKEKKFGLEEDLSVSHFSHEHCLNEEQ